MTRDSEDNRFDVIIDEMYAFDDLSGWANVRPVASNLLKNYRAEEALTYLLGAQDILSDHLNTAKKTQNFIREIRTKIKQIAREPHQPVIHHFACVDYGHKAIWHDAEEQSNCLACERPGRPFPQFAEFLKP